MQYDNSGDKQCILPVNHLGRHRAEWVAAMMFEEGEDDD